MLLTIKRAVGKDKVRIRELVTDVEDFSFFALEAPGLFVFLGITPEGQNVDGTKSSFTTFLR